MWRSFASFWASDFLHLHAALLHNWQTENDEIMRFRIQMMSFFINYSHSFALQKHKLYRLGQGLSYWILTQLFIESVALGETWDHDLNVIASHNEELQRFVTSDQWSALKSCPHGWGQRSVVSLRQSQVDKQQTHAVETAPCREARSGDKRCSLIPHPPGLWLQALSWQCFLSRSPSVRHEHFCPRLRYSLPQSLLIPPASSSCHSFKGEVVTYFKVSIRNLTCTF